METTNTADMSNASNDIAHDYAALEYNLRQCSFGMRHLKGGTRVITNDMTTLSTIEQLEKLAYRIARTDEMPVMVERHLRRQADSLTSLGKDLWSLGSILDSTFHKNCAKFEFNPYLTVMLRAFQRHGCVLDGTVAIAPFVGLLPERKVALERIVRFVRRVCRAKRFKYIVRNYDRLGENNHRSACQHMTRCFAYHSRALIVRVDLYCHPAKEGDDSTEVTDKLFARFLRSLRSGRIVPDILTVLHRREMGFERGLHFHVFVAMDGHKHQKGYSFAEDIGGRWGAACAAEELIGSYFNNFTRQGESRFDGLGLVHISDERKLKGVREALRYITKGYFKVRPTGAVKKNFRRGLAKRFEVKLGAPRKPEHDMEVVMRILGTV